MNTNQNQPTTTKTTTVSISKHFGILYQTSDIMKHFKSYKSPVNYFYRYFLVIFPRSAAHSTEGLVEFFFVKIKLQQEKWQKKKTQNKTKLVKEVVQFCSVSE